MTLTKDVWTKTPYGGTNGRWTLTNGHIRFDVHLLVDGSGTRGDNKYIVTPEEADAYAERIMNVLNEAGV